MLLKTNCIGSSSDSTDVRYSLSSVPREEANLEAEGGETVLTDLNQDGNFGLYDITGPRHSSGGVPMYLPDQSFIFSDTGAYPHVFILSASLVLPHLSRP